MKKILHLVLFVSIGFSTSAQVIFNETFDRVPGSISGGQGTYAFPAGWLLRNVDNRTPYPTVNYVNDAWERREDFLFNVNDSCAFSTSYYNPVGAADDWMWTPPITITGCNPVLSWNSVAYDPLYPDGYEVRIMVAPNEPTGGPGDIGNQVTSSALLYSIAAANTVWTNNQVNLSSYIGQTVRIAFRNNSNDQFLLAIDDVKVEATLPAILFNETFDNISGSISGGQGTYAFPAGWLLRNVDNRTPYPTVNYVNDAWERREDFKFTFNDSCAFSTSYYNPVGAADDWMWTPPITITGCNPVLSWNSVAYDPAYPDGYEVRVMVAPNEPTGGPGDIGNQVSNSALLYSIAAANTAWTNNQVNLSSYIGQTVRIAFRNYSNDQFLLAIDDVKVENVFTVLAVNNFSLVGKSVYGTNKLNWKNEEILNMPYSYDLERSIDQRSWESIYPIQSTGRANTATFNYEDVQIKNKICYYRVKVRTELNKIYYSNVVRLSNENSNSDIRIYPNPVVNDLQVDMADYANKTIIITDVMGKKVLAKKLTNTHSVFSISNLPPGTYQVNVVEGTRSVYVSKIVLVK